MDSSSKNSTKRRRLSFNNGGGDHQVSTNHNVSAAPSVSSSSAASAAAAPSSASSSSAASAAATPSDSSSAAFESSNALVACAAAAPNVMSQGSYTQAKDVIMDYVHDPRAERGLQQLVELAVSHGLIKICDIPGLSRTMGKSCSVKCGAKPELHDDLWLSILSFCDPVTKVTKLSIVSKNMGTFAKNPFAWSHPINLKLNGFRNKGIWNWCSALSVSREITLDFDFENVTPKDIAHMVKYLSSVEILKLGSRSPFLKRYELPEDKMKRYFEFILHLPRTHIRELSLFNIPMNFGMMRSSIQHSVGGALTTVTLTYGGFTQPFIWDFENDLSWPGPPTDDFLLRRAQARNNSRVFSRPPTDDFLGWGD